ncbi:MULTISPECIES: hypothetical protein [Hymenobacter]|uniref:Uncharacterized protein n=1 Tax=Hymenobacter mucosus TaxID=1411120 RepID=A0A238ZI44_9BACT|nr:MULTISPECIES: hypothetical protein [Hymenobacter]SNR82688.1 hypothetical protein SAMN06269173_10839 [Hymenobacter mucosus]
MTSVSYRTLFIVLLVGLGLMLLASYLKTQQIAAAGIVVLMGLVVQFVAGVLMIWKFASRLDKSED